MSFKIIKMSKYPKVKNQTHPKVTAASQVAWSRIYPLKKRARISQMKNSSPTILVK
jgi:hypothetical protein